MKQLQWWIEGLHFAFIVVPINAAIWRLIPCEWSHPYGRTTRQRLRSESR